MKKLLLAFVLIIIVVGAGGFYYYHREQTKMSFHESDRVIQTLKQGNERFVSGKSQQHDYQKQILDTKDSQHPEALVLSCVDSRSIPELAFDQGIGSILTLRVAGNVINQDMLGSMEFGAKNLGLKLIVVLGHTNCGAVTAACKGVKLGNLTNLLQQIQPAVQTTEAALQKSDCSDSTLIDAIAKQNVIDVVKAIPEQSVIIASMMEAGTLKIVGAMYDVSTGKVTFLNSSESKKSSLLPSQQNPS